MNSCNKCKKNIQKCCCIKNITNTTINSDFAGRDGLSAYEIAVKLGKFSGTEEQWVEWNKGDQGIKGDKGDQGIPGNSLYTWFRFADDPSGSGISSNPLGKYYLGLAYNKTSPIASDNPNDYIWYRTKGDVGMDGKPIELRKGSTHIQWRYIGENWIDLVELSELKGEKGDTGGQADVDALTLRVNQLFSVIEPMLNGSTSIWYRGNPAFLPTGWVEDIDMRGYFPLHRETTSQAINITGGAKTVQLTGANLPAHHHYLFGFSDVGGSSQDVTDGSQVVARRFRDGSFSENYAMKVAIGGATPGIGKSSEVGQNIAHENMPPYKVGIWIKYIGG